MKAMMMTILLTQLTVTAFTAPADPFQWDAPSQTAKPWARWWWLGSAVTEGELARQLNELRTAGFGGVEIQPIYAASDSPIEPIPYLSETWVQRLRFTIEEAKRLGMGVDLTLGSGWPFGGPWIEPEHAARRLLVEESIVKSEVKTRRIESTVEKPVDLVVIQPLAEKDSAGSVLDEKSGGVWEVPAGEWRVFAITDGYTRQQVKRATVGAEGPVLDHFSREAFDDYIKPFNRAIDWLGESRPRATFNDSFEVYGANWSPGLLETFRERMGYDLTPYLPLLASKDDSELIRRVVHDYRVVVEAMFYENFCKSWRDWSHKEGMKIRFQAHGSPGDLIDLYALADVPETEGFGRGGIDVYAPKFASSAAHLYGKPLTSSETFTWLDEHFQVSLDHMRKTADRFFIAGVNHIFYHGVPFTPQSVAFPGWMFYASTNVSDQMPWFKHVKYLNGYLARVQSVLQRVPCDPDVLLFYPIHDLFMLKDGARNGLQYCTIHNSNHWIGSGLPGTSEAAKELLEAGVQYDFVSGRAAREQLRVEDGVIRAGDSRYRALILAGCHWLEEDTLKQVTKLAREGAKVIVIGDAPVVVPTGDPNLPVSRESMTESMRLKGMMTSGRIQQVSTMNEALAALKDAGVKQERLAEQGFEYVRHAKDGVTYYILRYAGEEPFDGWVSFASEGARAVEGDPLRGTMETLPARGDGKREFRLRFEPLQAKMIALGDGLAVSTPVEDVASTEPAVVKGPWTLSWKNEAGESHTTELSSLQDWTSIDALRYFSGTASYETDIEASGPFRLQLDGLHESADVYLNDEYRGTIWTAPYRLEIREGIKSGTNTLRIEVTNLAANRMIQLDLNGVDWQKFYFVNIDYKKFSAAGWKPLPSGLLGPVTIMPME